MVKTVLRVCVSAVRSALRTLFVTFAGRLWTGGGQEVQKQLCTWMMVQVPLKVKSCKELSTRVKSDGCAAGFLLSEKSKLLPMQVGELLGYEVDL